MSAIGVVAIGRNEGERLRRCLECARPAWALTIVYVDSGSTDDSIALARSRGVEVVELDMSAPFSAARARNAGFERLSQIDPGVRFVQFLDGDCEVADGWLDRAPRRVGGPARGRPSSSAAVANGSPSARSTTGWPTSSGTCRWRGRRSTGRPWRAAATR